jgi:hypothetical protein
MKTFNIAILVLFISIVMSCKKDKSNTGSNYPKQVNIVYKVSSTTATTATIVQYRNEAGTIVDVTNTSLPYTKNISRSVNKNDVLSLGYGTNNNQTVKLEILVNNVSVQSQTFTGTAGAVTYLFE